VVTKNIELGRKFLKIQIPNEWSSSKLGDFATIHGRIGWKNLRADEYTQSGPLMLSVWSLVDSVSYGVDFSRGIHRLSEFRYEESPEIKLEKGDVLIAKDGDIGRIGFIKKLLEPTTVNSHVVVVRIKKSSVFPEYLYWFTQFKHFQSYCVAFTSGTTVPLLTQKDLKNAIIPLPPEREQKKISSILSNVDSLILSYDNIIEKTVVLRKGLIQQLLTKGIGHTKFKKEKLSKISQSPYYQIPKDWEIKPLKKITEINPESIDQEYSQNKILYVDIGSIEDFKITQYDEFQLGEQPSRAQRIIKKADIIVSTVRPYLKAFTQITIDKPNLICSTGFTVLRPKSQIDSDLIFNFVKSYSFETELIRKMEGMAYPAVTGKIVGNCFMPYSQNEKERKRIGCILSNADKRITELKSKKSILQIVKKGLMQKLLTGKIRVKI